MFDEADKEQTYVKVLEDDGNLSELVGKDSNQQREANNGQVRTRRSLTYK